MHVSNPNLGHSYLLKPIEHDLIRVISSTEQAERETDKASLNTEGFFQLLLSHTVTQRKVIQRVSAEILILHRPMNRTRKLR